MGLVEGETPPNTLYKGRRLLCLRENKRHKVLSSYRGSGFRLDQLSDKHDSGLLKNSLHRLTYITCHWEVRGGKSSEPEYKKMMTFYHSISNGKKHHRKEKITEWVKNEFNSNPHKTNSNCPLFPQSFNDKFNRLSNYGLDRTWTWLSITFKTNYSGSALKQLFLFVFFFVLLLWHKLDMTSFIYNPCISSCVLCKADPRQTHFSIWKIFEWHAFLFNHLCFILS